MTTRQTIDEYLDGALSSADRAKVEAMLASDPAAAALKSRLQRERAHRMIALASYEPSREEAAGLASDLLAACEAEALEPVGRVGKHANTWEWTRRLVGVAAAIGIAALAFAAGRSTAPPAVTKVVPVPAEIEYVLLQRDGDQMEVTPRMTRQQVDEHIRNWENQMRDFARGGPRRPGSM